MTLLLGLLLLSTGFGCGWILCALFCLGAVDRAVEQVVAQAQEQADRPDGRTPDPEGGCPGAGTSR